MMWSPVSFIAYKLQQNGRSTAVKTRHLLRHLGAASFINIHSRVLPTGKYTAPILRALRTCNRIKKQNCLFVWRHSIEIIFRLRWVR
jgi:hypothetical protein